MSRRDRLLLGAAVIVVALGALILTGVRQSVVYFVTPSELMAQDRAPGRAYRLGGMVVQVDTNGDAIPDIEILLREYNPVPVDTLSINFEVGF